MKKSVKVILCIFLGFFLLIALGNAVFYTSAVQKNVRAKILQALEREGIHAKIESLGGGILPNRLTLKEISIDRLKQARLSIKTATIRISLFHLLGRKIRLKQLKAPELIANIAFSQEQIPLSSSFVSPSFDIPFSFSIKSLHISRVYVNDLSPFSLKGKGRISSKGKSIFFSLHAFQKQLHLHAKLSGNPKLSTKWDLRLYKKNELSALQSKIIDAKGYFTLDKQRQLLETSGQLQALKLPFSHLEGQIFARWMFKQENGSLIGKTIAHIPTLTYEAAILKNIEIIADSTNCQGTIQVKGPLWEMNSHFNCFPTLQITDIILQAPQMQAKGSWEIEKTGSVQGTGEIHIDNLQVLKPFVPNWNPYGQLTAKISWKDEKVTCDLLAQQVYLKTFYFEQIALYSDIQNPLHNPTAKMSINMKKGTFFNDLQIDSALLETTIEGDSWPYELVAKGIWKKDFEVQSEGQWHYKKAPEEFFNAEIAYLQGLFYGHLFSLQKPVSIISAPFVTKISSAQIDFLDDGASIQGKLEIEKQSSSFYIELAQFPVDVFSVNPLEVNVSGKLDLSSSFQQQKDQIQGNFQASLTEGKIQKAGEEEIITAKANLNGILDQKKLSMKGDLSTREKLLSSFETEIPLRFQQNPRRIEILYNDPIKGKWQFDGHVEDVLDFFNLGSHWLQGRLQSDIVLSHTLNEPKMEGFLNFKEGYYENYNTGIQLTHLQADLVAQKGMLYLRALKAYDKEQSGALLADGSIRLSFFKNFPFDAHIALQNFGLVHLGFLFAKANGAIDIKGSSKEALAQGEIHIVESNITIADTITKTPPNLPVIYLNAQKPLKTSAASLSAPYPLHLHLLIDTPSLIPISGRGLQSTWEGKITLKGTASSPKPIGQITLASGEFSFAGRIFKLTKGSITYNDQNPFIPHIDVAGVTEQQGISIMAQVQGPLNNPQLTFQSNPPLPLSSIVAHLLFGEEISEINGLQALQLASTIATIAGQSPDVLESTRRSLGIDRLRIVSGHGSDGEDNISIQVGKYVAPGVLVFISQNTKESAPNVSIEVDIGSGFFFQAETDQIHEQGKFGIKWNRNY